MLTYSEVQPSSRQTRRMILDAARHEISAKGPRYLRLESVARSCGVSVRTLYRHFENKSDLYETSCLELINHICLSLSPIPFEAMSADDALLYHCLLLRDLFAQKGHRDLVRSLGGSGGGGNSIKELYERQIVRPINQPLIDFFMQHGAPADFARVVTQRVWQVIANLSETAGGDPDSKEHVDKVRRVARDYARLLRA